MSDVLLPSRRSTPRSAASTFIPTCPECGGKLPVRTVAGLCPRCLMGLGVNDTGLATRTEIDPTEALPQQFGRYAIVRELGRGAMGVVYLARDTELERLVALKVPQLGRWDERAMFERFQREVRAVAAIQHPHICPLYDVGRIDGVVFMTMAYIEGESLAARIARAPINVRQAVLFVRKLAFALDEAHRQGIVHRDLKPSNILLNSRGDPVLVDFGLAQRDEPTDVRLTRSGAAVGTPAYMSPEQATGQLQAVGPASDVYSLGAVLYEMLTGRPPFEGSLAEVLAQIVRDTPRPPSEIRPEVDRRLDRICLTALAKEPANRFANMAELAQALSEYARAEASTTPALRAEPAAAPDVWRRIRDRIARLDRRGWAGLAGVLAAVLTLGLLGKFREQPHAPTPVANLSLVQPSDTRDPVPQPATNAAADSLAVSDSSTKPTPPASQPIVVAATVPADTPVPTSPKPVIDSRETNPELPVPEPQPAPPIEPADEPARLKTAADLEADRLARLRQFGEERRVLAGKIREHLTLRDVDLRRAQLAASGAAEQANVAATGLAAEIQTLKTRLSFNAVLEADRREQERARADLAVLLPRYNAAVGELQRCRAEVIRLENQVLGINQQLALLGQDAVQLLLRMVWLIEPTGTLDEAEYKSLAELFTQWLRETGDQAELLALRALANTNARQYSPAEADVERALELQPQSTLAFAVRGYLRFRRGQNTTATKDLAKAVSLAPKESFPRLLRGLMARETGNESRAYDDFLDAVEADPNNPWCLTYLASQQLSDRLPKRRDPAKALRLSQKAHATAEPLSWFCWQTLARAHAANGDTTAATTAQRQAVELAPRRQREACQALLRQFGAD